MRIKSWLEEKVIRLIGMITDKEHTRALSILPDYETAFLLSIADSYEAPDTRPEEFIKSFYTRLRENLVSIKGKGREDIKELYTGREFYETPPSVRRERRGEEEVNLA